MGLQSAWTACTAPLAGRGLPQQRRWAGSRAWEEGSFPLPSLVPVPQHTDTEMVATGVVQDLVLGETDCVLSVGLFLHST